MLRGILDTASELANRAENAALLRYVDSVRQHGHRAAKIDPLDLLQRDPVGALDPGRYGLHDLDKTYSVEGILWNKSMPEGEANPSEQQQWKLKDIVGFLRGVYVGRIAYEFMHSPSKSERLWFTHMLESEPPADRNTTLEEKRRMWELMAKSESFDHFLQAKFPNLKRYGPLAFSSSGFSSWCLHVLQVLREQNLCSQLSILCSTSLPKVRTPHYRI